MTTPRVVADTTLDRTGSLVTPSTREQMMGREGKLVLVNGQAAPNLEGRVGERERWRIINACTSRYLPCACRTRTPASWDVTRDDWQSTLRSATSRSPQGTDSTGSSTSGKAAASSPRARSTVAA